MIGVATPMRLRASRGAQRWCEANGHTDMALVSYLEAAVADAADERGRDLTPAEVASGCAALVAQYQIEEQRRQSEQAAAATRAEQIEAGRLAYLARARAQLREEPDPPRAAGVLTLDALGRKEAARVLGLPPRRVRTW